MDLTPSLRQKLVDPLWVMLGSMAINAKLSSLLLYDTTAHGLEQIAAILKASLEITTPGKTIAYVRLSSSDSEDDLWGQLGLANNLDKGFCWQSGLLGQCAQNLIKIVLIPDLTMLSLSATRACVMAMGADTIHLERYGEQQTWQPHLFWLVGCSSAPAEIGTVSPHLLDRIVLRGKVKADEKIDRVKQLRQLFASDHTPKTLPQIPVLEPEFQQWLARVENHCPTIDESVWHRVIAYIPSPCLSHRRDLSLIRLAIAYGQLLGEKIITADLVDQAAQMMGFNTLTPEPQRDQLDEAKTAKRSNVDLSEPVSSEVLENEEGDRPNPIKTPATPLAPQTEPIKKPVYQTPDVLEDESILLPSVQPVEAAYAEDQVPLNREIYSLQLPMRQFKSKAIARGTIIGTERTNHPQDLAIVRTLLEAAKFKKIRQQIAPDDDSRLRIFPSDLFRYRRAPVAEQMLMIVLDYTCLDYCKWEEKLYPYLSWAYTQRATVGLVQVGVKTAQGGEFRAKKLLAKNVLVPAFGMGLNLDQVQISKATPLAHGLDLALTMLRHSLQHGSRTVSKAVMVVLSDGRGNIPLAASQQGQLAFPVGSRGVTDALAIADKIGKLDNLEAVWLNPQPKQYRDLPLRMALAMNAKVVTLPPVKTWEVDGW